MYTYQSECTLWTLERMSERKHPALFMIDIFTSFHTNRTMGHGRKTGRDYSTSSGHPARVHHSEPCFLQCSPATHTKILKISMLSCPRSEVKGSLKSKPNAYCTHLPRMAAHVEHASMVMPSKSSEIEWRLAKCTPPQNTTYRKLHHGPNAKSPLPHCPQN
jgi:hypothetical protein